MHSIPTLPAPSTATAAAVTGDAAASLGADGQFRLADINATYPDEITRDDAVALARAYVRSHAHQIPSLVERERRAEVEAARLHPCGRTVYAASSFEPVPRDAPGFVRRAFGPWWIVPLCETGAQPAVLLAVSALNGGNVRVGSDGRIEQVASEDAGTDFYVRGVPVGQTDPLVVTPERAVQYAADVSGQRVAGILELVAPSFRSGTPLDARWRFRLNAVARMRTAKGARRNASEVFAGGWPGQRSPIAVAASEQPTGVTLSWPRSGPSAAVSGSSPRAELASVTARRRADVPLEFEVATAPAGEAP